jgi:hypothetical protein
MFVRPDARSPPGSPRRREEFVELGVVFFAAAAGAAFEVVVEVGRYVARVRHAEIAVKRGRPVKRAQLLRLSRGVFQRSSPLCSSRSAGVVSSDRAFAAARLARR